MLPPGEEPSCHHSNENGEEEDQDLARSYGAVSGGTGTQNEKDQRKKSECELNVLPVDLLNEQREFEQFGFHLATFPLDQSVYNHTTRQAAKVASKKDLKIKIFPAKGNGLLRVYQAVNRS